MPKAVYLLAIGILVCHAGLLRAQRGGGGLGFGRDGGLLWVWIGHVKDCGLGSWRGVLIFRIFESFLVDGHHLDVGGGFSVDDALLVYLGPAEAEEEALDCDLGVGCGGGEVFGLVGGHGPEFGCAVVGLGETLPHGDDGLAAISYMVAGVAKKVVVVCETGLHARLFDWEQRNEAAFFGRGPYSLRWGEVAHFGGADGAGETGRRG